MSPSERLIVRLTWAFDDNLVARSLDDWLVGLGGLMADLLPDLLNPTQGWTCLYERLGSGYEDAWGEENGADSDPALLWFRGENDGVVLAKPLMAWGVEGWCGCQESHPSR